MTPEQPHSRTPEHPHSRTPEHPHSRTPEHRHPRRGDRSKDEAWIRAFLHRGEAAVLSGIREGRPFCLPRIYAYDQEGEAVYVHGAHGGEMGEVLERSGGENGVPMALAVFQMGRLLPADEALEFGVEYASVVVTGRAFEVEDPEEAERGLRLLMEKYAPHLEAGKDYRPVAPEEVARTSVIRIDIEAWSGKEKAEAGDFPGAYRLEDVRP
jgi:nitroimidazol reductase NimA-like FMN-containing flavoprotein (pyridoxamine 5'-phosphate oxidase superfamily)